MSPNSKPTTNVSATPSTSGSSPVGGVTAVSTASPVGPKKVAPSSLRPPDAAGRSASPQPRSSNGVVSPSPTDDFQFVWSKTTSGIHRQLTALLHDQRMYFSLIRRMSSLPILYSTNIPTLETWSHVLPHASNSFFKSRSSTLRGFDSCIAELHSLISSCNETLRKSRMWCTEETAVSSTNQVGFSYFGFDSQIFDVGKLACICPFQFFSHGSTLSFIDSDWEGALTSTCPGKELMSTSPNLESFYEQNQISEAKAIMHESSLQVLHNLSLAAYLRREHAPQSNSSHKKNFELSSGDIIAWTNVLSFLESVAANKKHREIWRDMKYVYNPDIPVVQRLLDQHGASASSSPSDTDQLRLLVDPISFLVTLRYMMDKRITKSMELLQLIGNWQVSKQLTSNQQLHEHTHAPRSASPCPPAPVNFNPSNKYDALLQLKECVLKDINEYGDLFRYIPDLDSLRAHQQIVKKGSTTRKLSLFLQRRPTPDQLVQKKILHPSKY